jgi:hypothetical protein
MRAIRGAGECNQCVRVRFKSLYLPEPEFLAMREPDLVILRARSMQAIPVVGGYPRDEIWRLLIDLYPDDASAVRHFRESFDSDRQAVYLSLNGQPLDVITAGQLQPLIVAGAFDSRESLNGLVGQVENYTTIEVGANDQSRARARAIQEQLEEQEATQKIVDELVEAIERGDQEKALRLQRELAERQ